MDDSQTESPSGETATQRQARIRRERREAKIKAGGSARLDKITSLSGRAAELSPSIAPNPTTDPDEVDISNHPYTSSRSPSLPHSNDPNPETDIRRLLRSGGPLPDNASDLPFGMGVPPSPQQRVGQSSGNNEDAMMGLLQQMMGGGSSIPGGAPAGGLPPELAALLGGGIAGADAGVVGQEQVGLDRHADLWKVVHALLALALGVYITTVTTFSGARFLRADTAEASGGGSGEALLKPSIAVVRFRFFWAFATAELGLQSARFFLDRGRRDRLAGGWLRFVVHALPESWAGWVVLGGRYAAIYTTVVQDAMVVVFVLGVVAWWRGDVGG